MLEPLRKVYHVSCRPHREVDNVSCWDVKAEDEHEAVSSHWTREEAASEAARLVMTLLAEEDDPALAQVVIHGENQATERVVVYSRDSLREAGR